MLQFDWLLYSLSISNRFPGAFFFKKIVSTRIFQCFLCNILCFISDSTKVLGPENEDRSLLMFSLLFVFETTLLCAPLQQKYGRGWRAQSSIIFMRIFLDSIYNTVSKAALQVAATVYILSEVCFKAYLQDTICRKRLSF